MRGATIASESAMLPISALASLLIGVSPAQAELLIPMDEAQTDHLKAYGLTYWALAQGETAEWLLNYRGGSFLLAESEATEHEASTRGVSWEHLGASQVGAIRAEIDRENMDSVRLEKAPTIAVYTPPNREPWDDAVTLVLEYAVIPYAKLWDEEVLNGELVKYDWLHLHHEDFTGQQGKFYAAFGNLTWYQEEKAVQEAMAGKLGYEKVAQLKAAVAIAIKDYVGEGGSLFGMCSATDTFDIALAADNVDIADAVYDGDPPDPGLQSRLDDSRSLAFRVYEIETDPMKPGLSEIDVAQEASIRGPKASFTLLDFSAKSDRVPTMLVQNHVNTVREFLGRTTGFRRSMIKSDAMPLAEVKGSDEVKYLHGDFGRGTFTFLGGHDPEDYQHQVGDPPTDLSRFRHSPGYRLILNNALLPAGE